MNKKYLVAALVVCLFVTALSGCKKELTKEEVTQTQYYQTLQKKYKKEKAKNKRLSAVVKENKKEQNQNKIINRFLHKLEKGYYIRMDIDRENTTIKQINDMTTLTYVNQLAGKVQPLTRLLKEETLDVQEPICVLYLIAENHATYAVQLYSYDWVVFEEMPDYVCVMPGITDYVRSFVPDKLLYPEPAEITEPEDMNALELCENATLVQQDERFYEEKTAKEFVAVLRETDKQKAVLRKKDGEPEKVYRFYYQGRQASVALYQKKVSVTLEEKQQVYRMTPENIRALETVFE
ncbi:MAG: hypothetical protein ACI4CT_06405 [Lachnospiraceae bacterium]